MKKYLFWTLLLLVLSGCQEHNSQFELKEGVWQGQLTTMDNKILPFNFNLYAVEGKGYVLNILNSEESILVDEISFSNDSITIKAPVFDGYITGTYTPNSIKGMFNIESRDRAVPFRADFGVKERFSNTSSPEVNVSGIWETEFSANTEDSYFGKGIFTQKGDKVTGTFRTNSSDYRYLEGVVDGDSLKLSAFDGARAFLFHAKVTDSMLQGIFYSGNHDKEPFTAIRNEAFELQSPDSLTFIKKGYSSLDFSFPDGKGKKISLSDETYKNKVVVVQIMGTWCPNCLDETKFLVEYSNANKNTNLEVIGLAFEYAKTEESAFYAIKRLKDRIGVKYPILLAQYGTSDKDKAQQKLPMLNHILAYPTTIFIDKKGAVRRIHTGFNGPATGDKYEEFKNYFDNFITELLQE